MQGDLSSIIEERHGLMNRIQKLLNELSACHGTIESIDMLIFWLIFLNRT